MGLAFYAPEVSQAYTVDMGLATGRIVLRLIGRSSQRLEGSMPVGLLKAQLASLSPKVIAASATPEVVHGPDFVDPGTPESWLTTRIDGLRQLVEECERLGVETVHWG